MNNEIEVGDFVRLKQGYIGTVENINDFREPIMKYAVDIQKRDLVFVGNNDIVKHSKIKSEIVEVGDYVNGKLVVEVLELVLTDKKHQERVVFVNRDEKCALAPLIITNKDIKTIVTKESFKEREYVF